MTFSMLNPDRPDAQFLQVDDTADRWSHGNPFARRLRRRLRSRGGLHTPSSVADDKLVVRDEIIVAMLREAHQLTERDVNPF